MPDGLFQWQEPYKDLFGKEVKVVLKSGHVRYGQLQHPGIKRSGAWGVPRKALAIVSGNGIFHLIRIEKIQKVEVKA